MVTPREIELEKKYLVLEKDYYELRDKYDQLVHSKRENNNVSNEGDNFLRGYRRN